MPKWNSDTPHGTDYIGDGARVIRDFKTIFKYIYEKEHEPSPIPPSVSDGFHKEGSLRSGFVGTSNQTGAIIHSVYNNNTQYKRDITQAVYTSPTARFYLNSKKHGKHFYLGQKKQRTAIFSHPSGAYPTVAYSETILSQTIINDNYFSKSNLFEVYLYCTSSGTLTFVFTNKSPARIVGSVCVSYRDYTYTDRIQLFYTACPVVDVSAGTTFISFTHDMLNIKFLYRRTTSTSKLDIQWFSILIHPTSGELYIGGIVMDSPIDVHAIVIPLYSNREYP